ncbi:hypothetical protein GYMLUDRAFT_38288 [Collybiopsis luxurians FD-317 M1]|nr:hypothetical protein GYMLUDRAFT_38288 [Collybiopsis luxurians FD-317 M1]
MTTTNNLISIHATFGALLLGGLLAASSSGVLCVQCVIYIKSCRSDSHHIKLVVALVWLLDTLHSFALCHGLWIWFISNYGNQDISEYIPISVAFAVVITALITIIAHGVFSWRIYRLNNNNFWMILPIMILAIFRLICACVTGAEMSLLGNFTEFRERFKWLFSLGLTFAVLADLIITLMMMKTLKKTKAKSISLNAVIDSLIMYTLENGAITSIASILSVIFWLAMKNLVFLGLYFVIAKLHANSVLAVFNYRQELRRTHANLDNIVELDPARFGFGSYLQAPHITMGLNVSEHSLQCPTHSMHCTCETGQRRNVRSVNGGHAGHIRTRSCNPSMMSVAGSHLLSSSPSPSTPKSATSLSFVHMQMNRMSGGSGRDGGGAISPGGVGSPRRTHFVTHSPGNIGTAQFFLPQNPRRSSLHIGSPTGEILSVFLPRRPATSGVVNESRPNVSRQVSDSRDVPRRLFRGGGGDDNGSGGSGVDTVVEVKRTVESHSDYETSTASSTSATLEVDMEAEK